MERKEEDESSGQAQISRQLGLQLLLYLVVSLNEIIICKLYLEHVWNAGLGQAQNSWLSFAPC